MPRRVDFRIPSLDEERDVVDLGAALIGVTGVRGVTADTDRHVLSVEFEPAFVDAAYLAEVVTKTGYPVAPAESPTRAADEEQAERTARMAEEDVPLTEEPDRLTAPVAEFLEADEDRAGAEPPNGSAPGTPD
ncbi:MAG TPA: hypothetical protein VFN57_02645 [Thermomicrobiaceae bacterium]|nr:hypothetical protein [Thermomicrobiaceae bacterium]